MSATINEIVDAMVATLDDAFSGLQVPVQVVAHPFANLSPPAIVIRVGDGGDQAMGFGDIQGEIIFTIGAWIDVADTEASWRLLYDMIDSETEYCIALPLSESVSLGALVSSVSIDPPTGPYEFRNPDGGRLGGYRWRVTVTR